jgi:uncharacterized SAM-binding protein YcdF (DUF218 family)
VRILFGVAGTLVVAWLVVCAFLFVWPEDDEPRRADAIVVLAGGKKQRLEKALELVDAGVARVLVISDGRDPTWPEANRLCDGARRGLDVVCFRSDPYSTTGEAEEVGRFSRARRWDSIAVVTSTFHVFRARLLFDRCLDGRVDVVAAGHNVWYLPRALVWETGKLAWAVTIDRDC